MVAMDARNTKCVCTQNGNVDSRLKMVVMDTVNINCVHTQNGNGDSRLNGGHGYSEY